MMIEMVCGYKLHIVNTLTINAFPPVDEDKAFCNNQSFLVNGDKI